MDENAITEFFIEEVVMWIYKRCLKILLGCNILFILIVSYAGFCQNHGRQEMTQVLNNINAQNKVSKQKTTKKLLPVGKTVGIYVNTKGILVIDTGEVIGVNGCIYTPAKNKLMPGDYILKLNNKVIYTKKQLISEITNCCGKSLIFNVERNGHNININVEPIETEKNIYKVGIWVRDDLQGLGTITYMDGSKFGALGHSINDADTGEMLEVSNGQIYEADIFGVEKGKVGNPGVIEGVIAYETENVVGNIKQNTLYGIFGEITEKLYLHEDEREYLEIGNPHDVKIGTAYIQSYVSGKKELYEVQIENVHKNQNGDSEMEIQVTDDKLICLSGGIVQGMSGSPIIQNGKIIGAVTHVFVDDPTRGYAIFIEEMLNDN